MSDVSNVGLPRAIKWLDEAKSLGATVDTGGNRVGNFLEQREGIRYAIEEMTNIKFVRSPLEQLKKRITK